VPSAPSYTCVKVDEKLDNYSADIKGNTQLQLLRIVGDSFM